MDNINLLIGTLLTIFMVCATPATPTSFDIGNKDLHYPYAPIECEPVYKIEIKEDKQYIKDRYY